MCDNACGTIAPMRELILPIIIAISIIGVASPPQAANATFDPRPCHPLEVIWLRGSGQTLDDVDYQAFFRALRAKFQLENVRLNYGITELDYPAVTVAPTSYVGLFNATGAFFSSGQGFAYGASVESGITSLVGAYRDTLARCPDTQFALAGYSQGAQIIADALSRLDPARVAYAALRVSHGLVFPKESAHTRPPAEATHLVLIESGRPTVLPTPVLSALAILTSRADGSAK